MEKCWDETLLVSSWITGIHEKQWTREQAIGHLVRNTPNTEADCSDSKILELRQKARESLGDKFDIREFHEVLLSNGSVPFGVLEELVDRWIQSKQTGRS